MILLSLFWIYFVQNIHCYAYYTVTKTLPPLPKGFNAVDHMQQFLKNVQTEVKNSRVLLKRIDYRDYVRKDAGAAGPQPAQGNTSIGIEDVLSQLGISNKSPMRSPGSPIMMNAGPILKMLTSALTAFLRMGTEGRQQPGDILSGLVTVTTEIPTTQDPFEQSLHDAMVAQNTGYASAGFERLCEQIALKNPDDVTAVMKHAAFIAMDMDRTDRLGWLGEPMITIFNNLAMAASEMPMDEFKSYAIMLHFTMVHRRNTISPEVNSVIDYADSFVDVEYGTRIFHVIRNFKDFPNVTKTGKQMCEDIIEAFEAPYRSLQHTSALKDFIKIANKAFKDRHPQFQRRSFYFVPGHISGYRSKRKHSINQACNRRRTSIPPLRRRIIHSDRHTNRRRNVDALEAALATRQLVSIKDFNRISKDRYTTRKDLNNVYKNAPNEEVVRKLSMENNNYYREVSKEEFGIKKILADTNEAKDIDEEGTGNMHNDFHRDFDKVPPDVKVPHRFHMTNRDHFATENSYYINGVTRKLLGANIDDIADKNEDKKQKRFNVINPLPKEAHWIGTTKPTMGLQIRRTTQYKKPRNDRYKVFDRRTTEFKGYRRANIPNNLRINDGEFLKQLKVSDSQIKLAYDYQNPLVTAKTQFLNDVTTEKLPNYGQNLINNEYLRQIASSVSHSDENVCRVGVIDHLVYNNSAYKDIGVDKSVAVIDDDNVEKVLRDRLRRAYYNQY